MRIFFLIFFLLKKGFDLICTNRCEIRNSADECRMDPNQSKKFNLKMSQHKIVGHQYFNFDPHKWLILNEFISSISSIWFASRAINEWIQYWHQMFYIVEHGTAVFQSPQCFGFIEAYAWNETNRMASILCMLHFSSADKLMMAKLICARYKHQNQMILVFRFSTVSCGKTGNRKLNFIFFHCIHFIGNIQRKCM